MYTGKIQLTNPGRVPLSLSNNFTDTLGLTDDIKRCTSAEDFCRIANKYHDFNYKWAIAKDDSDSTRLSYTDKLGNIEYLIAYKEKLSAQVNKNEIIDAITRYSQTNDNGNIEIAREKGQALFELLKKIVAQ